MKYHRSRRFLTHPVRPLAFKGKPLAIRGQCLVGSLAGAAHLSKGNAGVPRPAQQKGNPLLNKRAKPGSMGFSSAGNDRESTAYRFLLSGVPSVEQEVSDKLPQG